MEKSKIGSLVITGQAAGSRSGSSREGDISRAVSRRLDVEKVRLGAIMGKPLITAKRARCGWRRPRSSWQNRMSRSCQSWTMAG